MELIRNVPLNSTWMKAAVIGSLWASVEFVVGSFLHNLQIPFSGTILTAFAIFLLTAFSRLWKENGIIWRAAVICALMKSISPSAIIIGPMVGILTEAILFEMMVRVLGKNLLGYLAGGALAALSAIIHKLITLLLLYGFDFVAILDSLYHYAIKQLNVPNVQANDLIMMLTAMYCMIGVLAVLVGFFIGNEFLKKENTPGAFQPVELRGENRLSHLTVKQSYSTLLIGVHLFVLTGILLLLNLNHPLMAWTVALVYMTFCLFRYPTAFRIFKKISVWFQFILVVVTTILIWDVLKFKIPGDEPGWSIGFKMVGRATLLIVGFSAISVELKNPLVKALLYKRGLANLYQSLTMTFGVLPDLVASLARAGWSILNPAYLSSHLLFTAKSLIQYFKDEQSHLPVVFIISGEVGEGKTTFTATLLRSLQNKGLRTSGFLSFASLEGSLRSGFRLVNIDTQESITLCETIRQEGWSQTGRYYFNPLAFDFGKGILDPIVLQESQLVVIDELGPLEMNNQGWFGAVERLCANSSTPQLWIVRKNLVHKIARKWSVGDCYIFDIAIDSASDVESTILSVMGQDISSAAGIGRDAIHSTEKSSDA